MAYTAVKLADVQRVIAAVTAANKKYTDAQASSKTSETAVNTARKALETAQSKLQALQSDFDNQKYLTTNSGYKTANTALTAAEKKLNDARSFLDSGQFLEKNSAYQNALKAIQTAEKNRDAAQSRLDSATDKTRASLERALTAANKTVDTAYTNADKARAAAEKLAQTSISTAEKAYDTSNANLERARIAAEKAAYIPITNQQKALDSQQKIFDTAQNKYQSLMDSFQPLLDQRNEAINNVSSYIDTIRGSLGDVTKFADAKQVQTLLGQIQTAVKGTKLDDLIRPVSSMISEIDPLKMAAIPKVNIPGANPDVFSNIDPNTGLPILDQGGLDSVLDRYKSNKIDTQQYRDNYDKFGWNVKSDASTAMRGPAIVGLDMGTIQQGMSGGTRGIVKAGTNQAASDADFKKAADQLGININDYYTTKETTGAYGQKGTAQVLDRQSLYNDIADRTKDFYMVANSIDGNKHAALLFRADGSGNLIPVTNDRGAPMANYYTATRNVTGETWYGDLLPIAAIAASFALPGLSSALAGQIGTVTGLGAVGAGGAISGALAGAITNAGFAALTGGDIGKAALMGGAGSLAQAESAKIANSALGGAENVQKIADFAGISLKQAQQTIAQGITTGLASAAVAPNNIAENVIANVAGNFGSAKAQNAVSEYMKKSEALPFMFDAAGNVARVGAEALVRGEDLSTALQSAMPSIIASGAGAQKDYAEAQKPSSQAALAEGQVGALDYRPTPDESQLKFYKVDPFGDPVYIGPDNETYTITPEGKVTLYADVTGYAQEPSGPDYSTIAGQAGAGGLSGFGAGLTTPSGYQLATPLPYGGLRTGPDYSDIQQQAKAGALGSYMAEPKLLPEVPVIAERELQSPLYPYDTEELLTEEEYQKASQEFPLTPYDPSRPTGLGTIKRTQEAQAALQQANKVKQQQALTQQLLDPKSIYYLTPEEQEARGYFNPVQMFESVSPFRKGGLARMKRNTKWQ